MISNLSMSITINLVWAELVTSSSFSLSSITLLSFHSFIARLASGTNLYHDATVPSVAAKNIIHVQKTIQIHTKLLKKLYIKYKLGRFLDNFNPVIKRFYP